MQPSRPELIDEALEVLAIFNRVPRLNFKPVRFVPYLLQLFLQTNDPPTLDPRTEYH